MLCEKRMQVFKVVRTLSAFMIVFSLILMSPVSISAQMSPEPVRFAEIKSVHGPEVFYRTYGKSQWEIAEPGIVLGEKDELRTGRDSRLEIYLDENAETGKFTLKEDAVLRLTTLYKDKVTEQKVTMLDVALGEVIFQAEKLKGNSRFEVRTPISTTGVHGTVFAVQVLRFEREQ